MTIRSISIRVGLGALVLAACAAGAHAQTQVKGRALVMVDSSGSMVWHFGDCRGAGGDGGSAAVFCDNGIGTGFDCSQNLTCSVANGGRALFPITNPGQPSRLYSAKAALNDILNSASGYIDFGLERYTLATANDYPVNFCPNASSGSLAGGNYVPGTCCTTQADATTQGRCVPQWTNGYADVPASTTCTGQWRNRNGNVPSDCNITYLSGCGSSAGCTGAGCTATEGGEMLVFPQNGSSQSIYPWVDFVEDFCSSTAGAGGQPRNPELRAAGGTPLAGAIRTARKQWYTPIFTASNGGNCDPKTNALCDTQIQCRSYVNVVMTDGGEDCEKQSDWFSDPQAAVTELYNVNATNPVKTYVLAMSFAQNEQCNNNVQDSTICPKSATGPGITNGCSTVGGTSYCACNANTDCGATCDGFKYVCNTTLHLCQHPALNSLNQMATNGGTDHARFVNSQQDIEAAFADIIASTEKVEICDGLDNDCDGACDEPFPDVGVVANPAPGQTCSNPRPAKTCNNGFAAATHCAATGNFACSLDHQSEVCNAPACLTNAAASIVTGAAAGNMRITGVSGFAQGNVGNLVVVSGAASAANNGAFPIVAVNSATSIDVANGGFAGAADANNGKISWFDSTLQGAATLSVPSPGTERLTVTSFGVTPPSDIAITVPASSITVAGAATAADNGTFKVIAVNSSVSGGVTTYTIDLQNPGAATSPGTAQWTDLQFCPASEICNGLDDDCNGVIDDCTPGVANSCCTMNCPACAKPPFIETCNGCDDDCDGVIDDHLVDTGLACGNNVGDCAPGLTVCCSSDPSMGPCNPNQTTDRLFCNGGNPGYPVSGFDRCDGTDDNCNGIVNDDPPAACYVDQNTGMPFNPTLAGVGACHAGTKPCMTVALPAGSGGCPAGWPNGKTCPNPTPTYGACSGGIGPQGETCNGVDDDCNGCIDDNLTDPWLGQACCPTGNMADCMNSGGSNRCHPGAWQCLQAGGACTAGVQTCVGAVAKSAETCNMVDDDCNGVVDDLPGKGSPCTGTGILTQGTCKAVLTCLYAPDPKASPNLVCVQTVGPMAEMCNGLDDDCNGVIDNPPFVPTPGQPVVGTPCEVPMAPADKPPCKAGTNLCIAGMVVCEGAVGPMPNQCNGISTDCTGNPNTNGNCPTGFQCYQGNCVQPCSDGEFPCAGGYACNRGTNQCDMPGGPHTGCCVPDACAKLTCPTGDVCQLDPQGNGQCIDPCASITCGNGYVCKLGACQDASCRVQGCPTGQICTGTPPACAPDPCANVTCSGFTYCDNGTCVAACSGPCPPGQNCDNGKCVADPCAHVNCLEGQACVVSGGVGTCVANQCAGGCNPGQVCCGGSCETDPCINIHCPEDTHCTVTSACGATCNTNPASAKDQIVGAGGGGFGCAVGGSGSDGNASLGMMLFAALALLWRRRRNGTGEVQ